MFIVGHKSDQFITGNFNFDKINWYIFSNIEEINKYEELIKLNIPKVLQILQEQDQNITFDFSQEADSITIIIKDNKSLRKLKTVKINKDETFIEETIKVLNKIIQEVEKIKEAVKTKNLVFLAKQFIASSSSWTSNPYCDIFKNIYNIGPLDFIANNITSDKLIDILNIPNINVKYCRVCSKDLYAFVHKNFNKITNKKAILQIFTYNKETMEKLTKEDYEFILSSKYANEKIKLLKNIDIPYEILVKYKDDESTSVANLIKERLDMVDLTKSNKELTLIKNKKVFTIPVYKCIPDDNINFDNSGWHKYKQDIILDDGKLIEEIRKFNRSTSSYTLDYSKIKSKYTSLLNDAKDKCIIFRYDGCTWLVHSKDFYDFLWSANSLYILTMNFNNLKLQNLKWSKNSDKTAIKFKDKESDNIEIKISKIDKNNYCGILSSKQDGNIEKVFIENNEDVQRFLEKVFTHCRENKLLSKGALDDLETIIENL